MPFRLQSLKADCLASHLSTILSFNGFLMQFKSRLESLGIKSVTSSDLSCAWRYVQFCKEILCDDFYSNCHLATQLSC